MRIIRYTFTLTHGAKEVFDLHIDADTLELVHNVPSELPHWTELDFQKCPHCPLSPEKHPHCPLAANLVTIVERLDGILSHDDIYVEVDVEGRTTSQATTAQRGISSMMGLIMATSGCPHTAMFKPMAQFHHPLSTREETIFRATSMYMLAQYLLLQQGHKADLTLEGLKHMYTDVQTVNTFILRRLYAAVETDSLSNALIVLDIYAKSLEWVIEESLERLWPLFDAFVDRANRMEEGE
jgi:hypothetical protein